MISRNLFPAPDRIAVAPPVQSPSTATVVSRSIRNRPLCTENLALPLCYGASVVTTGGVLVTLVLVPETLLLLLLVAHALFGASEGRGNHPEHTSEHTPSSSSSRTPPQTTNAPGITCFDGSYLLESSL